MFQWVYTVFNYARKGKRKLKNLPLNFFGKNYRRKKKHFLPFNNRKVIASYQKHFEYFSKQRLYYCH